MKITTFATGGDFLAAAGSFLETREALNNLMLGIAGRYAAVEGPGPRPLFISIADEGSVRLACLMTPPQRLVIYSDGKDIAETLGMLTDHLIMNGVEIPGVIGPVEISAPFAAAWISKKGCDFELSMKERAYELRTVADNALAPGRFMKAGENEIELLSGWVNEFSSEALGEKMEEAAARELMSRKIKAGDAFIWLDDSGFAVTMACAARPTRNGIAVNSVYTPPQYRKKGYATSCVAKLSAELLGRGYKFCTLFTDLKNPVSNGIYQKIGYKPVCDFNQYDFKK